MNLRAVLLGLLAVCAVHGAAVAAEPMVEFEVTPADTLIGLSRDVLVSPSAWREVARINRLANPNRIRAGQRLLIPPRLMRSETVEAVIVSINGDVRLGATPAVAGAKLAVGQPIETGAGGSAVISLADGSQVRMPPSSLAEVAASRRYAGKSGGGSATIGADTGVETTGAERGSWFAGTLRLLRGSVEIIATRVLRVQPLEVVTPTAVVGVRGTRFRVAYDEAAEQRTHSEVLQGEVRFAAAVQPVGADLAAGFGAAIKANQPQPVVAPLLAAPDLDGVAERFERPIVRFSSPSAATPLRVQVAADGAFERIVQDQVAAPGSEVRIVGLEDAVWHLRARRVDVQGIEGFDATRLFVLKARPEPPVYRTPRTAAKQSVGQVEFSWAPNLEAARVRLQVAEEAGFTKIVSDTELPNPTSIVELNRPGAYHWRAASIRPGGDQGPYGDAQQFELRPTPEPATGGVSADGNLLVFTFGGRPQDRQRVELASDALFSKIVASSEVTGPAWSLPPPSPGGRYYFRYRSVEPDGFVTPYSATVSVEVPRDWSGLGLLLPLLLLF